MKTDAEILLAALRAVVQERPSYLPSEAWENLKRNPAVIDNEKATKIEEGIQNASKEQLAAILSTVRGVFTQFLAPGLGGLIG